MIRAIRLDASLYEEVELDGTANLQATTVVVISSVAMGLGAGGLGGPAGIMAVTLMSLVAWYIWAYATYLVGTRFLPETQTNASHGQLLRTMGFASAPGIFRLLGVVPVFGPLMVFISYVWMLAAMVVATKQALDYSSTSRAFLVCLIGFIAHLLPLLLLLSIAIAACGVALAPF
jgi:hypothetical protein